MAKKSTNHKIIFGLKVKQLRLQKGLSFADLSKQTSMSVSYLNEIEKGKKYPKQDKIQTLANALETPTEELTSTKLSHGLAPVGALLQSNFLNELPLDLFGIDLSKVVEIIANSPLKVGAFISTLVELSRTYAVREENFYFRALRAYQELNNNYFEDIEQEADRFIKLYDIPVGGAVPSTVFAKILEDRFNYTILNDGLDAFPELQHLRSLFNEKKKQLLLNGKLDDKQRAYQLAKEIAFNFLGLKQRPFTSSFHKIKSFEEVLNNYKAGYFAVALLVNRESFIRDIRAIFKSEVWQDDCLLKLTQKYQVSSSVLFQRFNVIPTFFGIENVYFIRCFHNAEKDTVKIDKELHLNRKHRPHSNGLLEHYCRRWIALSLFKQLPESNSTTHKPVFGIQRTKYIGTQDEYLCMTIAHPSYPVPNKNTSITIGLLINEDAKREIQFLNDPAIPIHEVNVTCERCSVTDCAERVAPPTIINKRNRQVQIEERLEKILK